MDLRTLRAFVEVVRRNGFSAASREIFASQPTVSKAVRQLEDEVGLDLLYRLPHGVRPTEAGEVVLRHAQAMLASRDTMLAELDALRGLTRGHLRLGLTPFGSAALFAPLVGRFRAAHPDITIALLEQGSLTLSEAVLSGEIEMAMAILPIAAGLEWQPVWDDPLVALLPEGDPLAGREAIRLEELRDRPLILFETGFALNEVIQRACAARGFTPREAARSGQSDFITALVASGLGVALLPRLMVAPAPRCRCPWRWSRNPTCAGSAG
ncbi:LysR family transcriptional regulator [Roseomonas gilardii]|uniref:LysR family transcriptional regulator n=1 Tax=Roseomonas gilardii TaxID=257708 RepID=UPI000E04FEAE|nr:LysR family transcriptional regulator [Roseomonas gilardii]SUE44093.1 HTH-type transcriptional regulator gltC [Roseomonas gilardii subsp. rosea]